MAPMRTGGGVCRAAVTASLQAAVITASGRTSAAVAAARTIAEVLPRVLSRIMGLTHGRAGERGLHPGAPGEARSRPRPGAPAVRPACYP